MADDELSTSDGGASIASGPGSHRFATMCESRTTGLYAQSRFAFQVALTDARKMQESGILWELRRLVLSLKLWL